jgi:hypothetical protein
MCDCSIQLDLAFATSSLGFFPASRTIGGAGSKDYITPTSGFHHPGWNNEGEEEQWVLWVCSFLLGLLCNQKTCCTCRHMRCRKWGVTAGMVPAKYLTRVQNCGEKGYFKGKKLCNPLGRYVLRPSAFHGPIQGTQNPPKILCAAYWTFGRNLSNDTTYSIASLASGILL